MTCKFARSLLSLALLLSWCSASSWAEPPAERMYAISETELSRLLSISISLDQVNAMLSRERESWRLTSDELVSSLETSRNELAWLRGELAPLMTELPALRETSAALSLSLANSEASVTSWRTQAEASGKRLEASARSMTRYADDLSRVERSRDRWRMTALILLGLGGAGLAGMAAGSFL